ncbi:uncharacterized protein F5Z01DRAFT_83011 [Emericellopsis atlantica]|uniref:Uncharacterized protein n=1 Tax=Emericellopsis atlantica TaxID=2614577 RepID=A0A9P7ZMA1_9HYPO|nr:uncharacterized protein F5Z01DRAFT_83011 [Emericellopsis atlantica]KAG9254635.1 hypothetical protein F5Z01DRAFT_83011 [Emericellopsis atlantica]
MPPVFSMGVAGLLHSAPFPSKGTEVAHVLSRNRQVPIRMGNCAQPNSLRLSLGITDKFPKRGTSQSRADEAGKLGFLVGSLRRRSYSGTLESGSVGSVEPLGPLLCMFEKPRLPMIVVAMPMTDSCRACMTSRSTCDHSARGVVRTVDGRLESVWSVV